MKHKTVIKRCVGIALVVGVVGYYAHHLLSMRAGYAVIAAPRQTITSPLDGKLNHSLSQAALIEQGARLASVRRDASLDQELRRSTTELHTLQAEIESLESLVAFGAELKEKGKQRQTLLRSRRSEQLVHAAQQSESELLVKRSEADSATVFLDTANELCTSGLMSARECEMLRANADVAARNLEVSKHKLELATFALNASRQNADVAVDSASEIVYQRQHEDQLELRLADLRRELAQRRARSAALSAELADIAVEIVAPHRLFLWNVGRGDNTLVNRGEVILEFADCSNLFVFALLPIEKYEKLAVGDAAEIEVRGETFPGQVAQLVGPASTVSYGIRMFPLPPLRDESGQKPVEGAVKVSSPALAKRFGRTCQVGALVDVGFEPPPTTRGVIESLLALGSSASKAAQN